MTNLPRSVQPHHIATTCDNGRYTARFRYFTSPAPHQLVKSFAKCGLTVRRIAFDGRQTEVTIIYTEAA